MESADNKHLQELLVLGFKDENSLTDADIAFIRARASYVKDRHKKRLSKTFDPKWKPSKVKKQKVTPDALAHPAAI